MNMRPGGVILILLGGACTGCDAVVEMVEAGFDRKAPAKVPRTDVQDEPIVVPDGPPAKLAKLVRSSEKDVEDLGPLLTSGVNYSMRLAQVARHIDTGIAAAEKLAEHAEATGEQRDWARLSKMQLLYQGTQHDRSKFTPRLEAFVGQIQSQDAGGSLAPIGAAILLELEVLSDSQPGEEALAALIDYVQKYPQHPAGASLFEQYGQQLEAADRQADAMRGYRVALELYENLPIVRPLAERLARLERNEQMRIDRERSRIKKVENILTELGGYEDGYFLIYAHEVKAPSGGAITTYRFEYDVLRGPDAAVAYVNGLKKNWQWELIRRFPETPNGRRHANGLSKQLTKKRTYMKY